MDNSIGIVVGIDIAHDYTQVSYYTAGMNEPESMSTIYNEQKYLIPTVLFKWENEEEWLIGDEAMLRAGRNEGKAVDGILEMILTGKSETIDGKQYEAKQLFEKYIELLFEQIKKGCNCQNVNGVAVTIEYPDRVLVDMIFAAIAKCNIDEENIRVIGHSEALLYYIINQKKEIWVNDVAMFDYSREHYIYRRVTQTRGNSSVTLKVDEFDLTGEFPYEYLKTPEGRNEADEKLKDFIEKEFRSHIVSAVFLTGSGFYDADWIDKALPSLCNKRRVFKGHNLFVKGACYGIMEKLNILNQSEYVFQCTGRTAVDIGIVVWHNDRDMQLWCSKAGVNWYEAGAIVECILDDVKEVKVVVANPRTKMSRNVVLDLSEFPDRPNKTTRIEITVAYKNAKQCSIIIKDKGFGDLFKASDKIVRKNINIEEMI